MATLPLDDTKTYEMLARGDSIGVFQFESEGMREALKKVRPTEFDDLVALVALYRPGAMDQIPTYARGKRDPEAISYPDERLRPILEATKGVILYQEQAMRIAKELAGFSGAKADDLRKAMLRRHPRVSQMPRPFGSRGGAGRRRPRGRRSPWRSQRGRSTGGIADRREGPNAKPRRRTPVLVGWTLNAANPARGLHGRVRR